MKGFISYAHDDLPMVTEFRVHLTATARDYDIPFWADDAIRAGQHWDDRIGIAINTADVFLLLVSPRWRASAYIQDREMPEIIRRATAAKGLIVPVILSVCGWQNLVGVAQSVPSRSGHLLPIDDWPKHRHGYDKARSEIEAAIQTTFGVKPAANPLHTAARANQDETPGPYWGSKAVALEASIAPSDADIAATTDRIVVNLHPPSRDAAKAFDASVRAWLADNPDPNWQGLDAAAHKLAQALNRPTAELADCVELLWRASVTLANFLASDKQLRSIPFGNRQTLPERIHGALNTLIITLAPWVRRFPTARELDDAIGAFLADARWLQPAYRVIEIAEQAALITQASAQMLRDQRSSIESDGRQGEKAGSYYLRATRNLLLEAGRLLANRLADPTMPLDAEDAVLIERARVVMADPDTAISEMIRSFTPDIGVVLENLRVDAAKPNFLRGDNSDTPRPPSVEAQPRLPRPADFETQARDMILRGERPPVEWRPFIQALDFGPLWLSTEGRDFSDLSLLADMHGLRTLKLAYSTAADLAPLTSLTGLQSLNLAHTQVTDLSALAGLTALQHLNLTATQVADLSALAGLTALQSLDLRNTQVTDLSALAGLTGLRNLDLTRTQVADLSALAGLTGLQRLDLRNTQVADLSALAGLTGLQRLDLRNTQVADLSALAGLTGLQSLNLRDTKVADLSALAGLNALQSLELWNTQVADLSALAGPTGLQSLDLMGTQVADLSALAGLTGLQSLDLMGTQVADLSALAGLTGLQSLDLMGTQVADLSALAGLTGLRSLDLMGTQVADLSALAGLTGLQSLDLMGTQVADLSALAGLTGLQSLDFMNTKVTDLSALVSLTKLTTLDIRGTQVTDVAVLNHIEELVITRDEPDKTRWTTPKRR